MNSSIVLLNLLRIALGNTKQDVMTIHSLDTYNYNIETGEVFDSLLIEYYTLVYQVLVAPEEEIDNYKKSSAV